MWIFSKIGRLLDRCYQHLFLMAVLRTLFLQQRGRPSPAGGSAERTSHACVAALVTWAGGVQEKGRLPVPLSCGTQVGGQADLHKQSGCHPAERALNKRHLPLFGPWGRGG